MCVCACVCVCVRVRVFNVDNYIKLYEPVIYSNLFTLQDIVLWLTTGFYHIPHTEDLPVTPTVGKNLQFFLLPYNYFEECPSMQSRDAIRVDLKNKQSPKDGLKVTQYVDTTDTHCIVHTDSLQSQVNENPDAILQTKRPRSDF